MKTLRPHSSSSVAPAVRPGRWWAWAAGLLLVAATIAAYWNSRHAPFVFDDLPAIRDNPTIRSLATALVPPQNGSGVAGRPLTNLSFAVNHALGGDAVAGYHAVNLLLHALAALVLWDVARRILALLPAWRGDGARREGAAWVAALLWAVHPLQTESVVCVVQRNEILAGLFMLLTLAGFLRSVEPGAAVPAWRIAAVGACLLGMASKEVTAVTPLLVFLCDGVLVAGSWREAWQRRWRLHAALALTWLPLAWLMASSGRRGDTVGFGLGVGWWEYLLTQCHAVVHYLRLTAWPHPLVVDYGRGVVAGLGDVWGKAALLSLLFGAAAIATWRRRPLGLLVLSFFFILAPSSSFVPLTTQTMAEHRMYLPLAALTLGAAVGLAQFGGRVTLLAGAMLAVALGATTVRRNQDYRSALVLWTETVRHQPDNPRVNANLALAHLEAGELEAAIGRYRRALELDPTLIEPRSNLGSALARAGRPEEAIPELREALRRRPGDPEIAHNLGFALVAARRPAEALPHFQTALAGKPATAALHNDYGEAMAATGRIAEATMQFEAATRLAPEDPRGWALLGTARLQAGNHGAAESALAQAVRLAPGVPEVRLSHALVLVRLGRKEAAIAEVGEALRLRPGWQPALALQARMREQR